MRFGVAIATFGRSSVLTEVLPQIRSVLRPGDRLVVVGVSPEDWPAADQREGVELLVGPRGSTLQRNLALDHLLKGDEAPVDAIVFFDDDFLPAAAWLDAAERLLSDHPDIAAFTGHVLADGILGPGFSPKEGLLRLSAGIAERQASTRMARIEEDVPTYGCNLGVRMSAVGDIRFDERLRLYAWQEDVDFSFRVARQGRRVRAHALQGVHLGVKTGRVPGKRLGYAQIVNPLYLVRKGTMTVSHALPLMARNIAANLARSIRPEPWVDRRGRLMGNLRAIADLCRGRLEPERVERI